MTKIRKDVLILGAGASGLMCAIETGKRGRSTLVADHSDKAGRKIRVSGGGRCNFTNTDCGPDNYSSANPHFVKSALARFGPGDFIRKIERRGIAYYEKSDGQLFCKETSSEIIRMLDLECKEAGVETRLNCRIGRVRKTGDIFSVETSAGPVEAASVVVATGGLSYPELGATDIGFRIAEGFGLKVTKLKPGLVPLVFSAEDRERFQDLRGLSFNAAVTCGKKGFRGQVLFTHRGLSGPAILQISSFWEPGKKLVIDLAPDTDILGRFMSRRRSRAEIHTIISDFLPQRLARRWCEELAPPGPLCSCPDNRLREISEKIHTWTVLPAGTEGYKTAEITCGGVDTDGLSSKTMEAGKVQGLFFVGEALDVNGRLGGYNLQWAWASGFAAGQYA
jgi:predicted Rossmann fold flavoprotein